MSEMIYGVHDKLPLKKNLLFSLQLLLSCFIATILIANICGVSVSAALVGAGLGTLAYIFITKKESPMFISSSGALVAPVLMALSAGGFTATAIGGLVSCVVYSLFGFIFTKVPVEKIYKVFPKAIIGAITCVIGINLMPFCLTYVQISGQTTFWGVIIALITMLSVALISRYAKGIGKVLPFLLGTMIGYAVAILITLTGVYPIVDFSVFTNLKWFIIPEFGFLQWQSINWASLASVIVLYLAYTVSAMMECLSDHGALGGIIGEDLYQKPGLNRIFIGTGIANLINGCCSGLGSTSYGEGISTVGFSRAASVRITIGAALMMIVLGFIGPVQALLASIPSCVFCGSALVLYGFIASSGIRMLQQVDLNRQKNLILVSVILSLGISGIALGGATLSLSATALALVIGVLLNLILRDKNGTTH